MFTCVYLYPRQHTSVGPTLGKRIIMVVRRRGRPNVILAGGGNVGSPVAVCWFNVGPTVAKVDVGPTLALRWHDFEVARRWPAGWPDVVMQASVGPTSDQHHIMPLAVCYLG